MCEHSSSPCLRRNSMASRTLGDQPSGSLLSSALLQPHVRRGPGTKKRTRVSPRWNPPLLCQGGAEEAPGEASGCWLRRGGPIPSGPERCDPWGASNFDVKREQHQPQSVSSRTWNSTQSDPIRPGCPPRGGHLLGPRGQEVPTLSLNTVSPSLPHFLEAFGSGRSLLLEIPSGAL